MKQRPERVLLCSCASLERGVLETWKTTSDGLHFRGASPWLFTVPASPKTRLGTSASPALATPFAPRPRRASLMALEEVRRAPLSAGRGFDLEDLALFGIAVVGSGAFPDLMPWERARVEEASALCLNFMFLCSTVSGAGGFH